MLSTGYAIQEELLFRYSLESRNLGETPIIFRDRERGKSKMALHEIIETLSVLFRLRWQRWFNPQVLEESG